MHIVGRIWVEMLDLAVDALVTLKEIADGETYQPQEHAEAKIDAYLERLGKILDLWDEFLGRPPQ